MEKKIIFVAAILILLIAVPVFPVSSIPVGPKINLARGSAYVVVFKNSRLPRNVDDIITSCGGRVLRKLSKIGVVIALPVADPEKFEGMLSKRSDIEGFGRDFIAEIPDEIIIPLEESEVSVECVGPVVTDPYYWIYQWHMWHTIEASPMGAWLITTGSHDVKVAILDTGIDYNHPDLAPNYDFELSRSFVDFDFDGIIDEDEMDYNGHGSHCAGIVAAAINNDPNTAKCVGVGPDLTLVNLKVMCSEGWGYFSWVIDAVYYAVENGIDVISMSFGGYVPLDDPDGLAFFLTLERLFNYADRHGVVCVASAGNEALDMDLYPTWVHVPSGCSKVISVMATDIYDELASYSNYGLRQLGISAPGGDFAFVEPEWYEPIIPPEYWNYWYGLVFSTYAWTATGYMYAWMGGTSMAAPHVAGVAGLILSVNPNLKPSQVKFFLAKGAKDIGDPGYDKYFNFGLLNAYNSVKLAKKYSLLLKIPRG